MNIKNKRIKLSTFLSILLTVLLITYTYSWMITEPSYGEVLNYHRDLIVASSGVKVDTYIYKNNDYVLYKDKDIVLENIAPNDSIRFKFVVKNTKNFETNNDIIFSNITGDLEVLKPYIFINSTSPELFVKDLNKDLMTTNTFDGLNLTNYIKFYDDFKVPAHSEKIIYWDIYVDKLATNEIVGKQFKIESIIFLNS